MIHGIGLDVVEVARVRRGLEEFGDRLARRILSDREWPEYERSAHKAHFLARRFAAKEAMLKALGTGVRNGLRLCDISVGHDPLGRPLLVCAGRLERALVHEGITRSHLSLTDERDYAAACVVLEKGP